MNTFTIKSLKGEEIHPYITALAELRIAVFKEYPYLYEGSLEYEINYLKTYVNCPQTTLILAFDKDRVIGASTAIPLEFETPECQQPFIENDFELSSIFYLGESVLLPAYRGQGVYKHFFAGRESAAREYGSLYTAFCAVVRQEDDKRRPQHYVPLDSIWQKFGYEKHPQINAYYSWTEIGDTKQTTKPMIFWIKTL